MTVRTLEYVQSPEEYTDISKALLLLRTRRSLYVVQPLLIAAAILIYLLHPSSITVAVGIGLVLLPSVQLLMAPKAISKRAMAAHRSGEFIATRAFIDDNLIEFTTEDGRDSRIAWKQVQEVMPFRDSVVLFLGQGQYIYIPRRAFEREVDWLAYAGFVRASTTR